MHESVENGIPPRADDPPVEKLRTMINEQKLLQVLPFSRATLLRMVRSGSFPRPTFISPNRRVWYVDEVADWQREVDCNPHRRRGRPASR